MDSSEKKEGVTFARRPTTTFLNCLYICLKESPGKNYRQIYGKSKASPRRNLNTGTPPRFF